MHENFGKSCEVNNKNEETSKTLPENRQMIVTYQSKNFCTKIHVKNHKVIWFTTENDLIKDVQRTILEQLITESSY